jgi:predicted Rossmann-fold nucleotide-binding protein
MPKDRIRYQICVSGAARGDSVELAKHLAGSVGREIVRRGHLVLSGATRGLPYYAAKAAKEQGGDDISSIGFSPAASRIAHVKKYQLPSVCSRPPNVPVPALFSAMIPPSWSTS